MASSDKYNICMVARPDSSLYENSSGVISTQQLTENYIDVFNHIKEKHNITNDNIILNAFSIGNIFMAKILRHVAVTEPEPTKRKFDAIVFQTPYTSISKIVKHSALAPKPLRRVGNILLKSFSSTYRNNLSVMKSLGEEGINLLKENDNVFTYSSPTDNVITKKPSNKFIRKLNENDIFPRRIDDARLSCSDADLQAQMVEAIQGHTGLPLSQSTLFTNERVIAHSKTKTSKKLKTSDESKETQTPVKGMGI